MTRADPFDYVIVGAGAAGSVLANRLSEDPAVRVALLEAGPDRNARRWQVRMPLAMVAFMAPALARMGGARFINWKRSEPAPGLQGRERDLPRGHGTGGSANGNGQIHIRGQREDFDQWRDPGNAGWGHDDLVPCWRKLEWFDLLTNPASGRHLTVAGGSLGTGIDPALHGTVGPLTIAAPHFVNPMTRIFLAAARAAGFALTPDFNGARQSGVGFYHFTQSGGERVTAEAACLNPVRHRANLTILAGHKVRRVVMAGTRAVGVECGDKGVTDRREVILSARTSASPHLLMLSCIGPARDLARHGIPLVQDVPGVGGNLPDQPNITLEYKARTAVPYGIWWRSLPRNMAHVPDWLFRRRGLFASTTAEAGGFVPTVAGVERPDFQLSFCAGVANTRNASGFTGHGVLLHVCQLCPGSTGRLTLKDRDRETRPAVLYNFFRGASSVEPLRHGVRLARRIMAQAAFARHIAAEWTPGPDVDSDGAIDGFIRNRVGTLFHPVGTCAMGVGSDAVVNPANLRLYRVDGLRVVDAPVMPVLVSANTVAATCCLAEKAEDLIRAEQSP